ncbi:MAG: hypothetical protein K2I25_09390, partial [Muribaculaceae bacterium]|nr:hypothetical protein [Muribaculaceae bacterium]
DQESRWLGDGDKRQLVRHSEPPGRFINQSAYLRYIVMAGFDIQSHFPIIDRAHRHAPTSPDCFL